MTPIVFRPHWIEHLRPLFSCYHGPAGVARDLGVVLCKPFGYEMLCAHRAIRHLAERLAGAGFPTVRLDVDGTGDSSGTDTDPDRFSAWLSSIEAAVHSLERNGLRRIALIGIRFGALLAAEYAKRQPVDTLVLVAPPASGRAYLRELRAFQALRVGLTPQTTDQPPGVEEVVGFVLTADTASQIQAANLSDQVRPARRVLVVARDDIKGTEPNTVEKLAELGCSVTLSRAGGYAGMMHEDPVKSVVPETMWSEIVRWLSEEPVNSSRALAWPVGSRRQRVCGVGSSPELVEEIVDIDGMFGILCRPAEGSSRALPMVLLHNVGANHHIGCNRIYVELARRWAALGFSVLRFDLVGIGDTPPERFRRENEVYSAGSISDSARAIRWLSESMNCQRFVLGGICSGAYVSYYAALEDPRISQVMLMNPLTFHWREGDSLDVRMRSTLKSTRFYRQAAFDAQTWMRAMRGEVHMRLIAGKMASLAWSKLSAAADNWLGTESDVAQGFRKLCTRGTRVLLVCGEDDGSRDVIAEHLGADGRRFRNHANFQFEIIRNTDHTFSPRPARTGLANRLTSHLLEGSHLWPSPQAHA
jgi:pimeloyl-ACP methyl ester carboxylesterase